MGVGDWDAVGSWMVIGGQSGALRQGGTSAGGSGAAGQGGGHVVYGAEGDDVEGAGLWAWFRPGRPRLRC